MEFKDKVIAITGGSKGIGRGAALAFAQQGAKVAICGRGQEALEDTAAAIEQAGGQPLTAVCDVTDQAQIDAFAKTVQEKFGAPDVLVNNAGIAGSHKFLDHPDDLWHKILDVNLNGVFRVSRAFASMMVKNRGGRIINIASVAGKVPSPYMTAYTTSKHAVIGLTRNMAYELNRFGITVNAVCPGYVDTPMTDQTIANMNAHTGIAPKEARKVLENFSPQKRLFTVEEVVHVILMLAGEAAQGITGQALSIDGGMLML